MTSCATSGRLAQPGFLTTAESLSHGKIASSRRVMGVHAATMSSRTRLKPWPGPKT